MSWEKKTEAVVLNYPVKWGEDTVSKLDFKPLTAEHMFGLKLDASGSMDMGQMFKIAGLLTEHEGGLTIIKMLHASDAMKVVALVSDFLDGSQATTN
jgi:hypothetical protein